MGLISRVSSRTYRAIISINPTFNITVETLHSVLSSRDRHTISDDCQYLYQTTYLQRMLFRTRWKRKKKEAEETTEKAQSRCYIAKSQNSQPSLDNIISTAELYSNFKDNQYFNSDSSTEQVL